MSLVRCNFVELSPVAELTFFFKSVSKTTLTSTRRVSQLNDTWRNRRVTFAPIIIFLKVAVKKKLNKSNQQGVNYSSRVETHHLQALKVVCLPVAVLAWRWCVWIWFCPHFSANPLKGWNCLNAPPSSLGGGVFARYEIFTKRCSNGIIIALSTLRANTPPSSQNCYGETHHLQGLKLVCLLWQWSTTTTRCRHFFKLAVKKIVFKINRQVVRHFVQDKIKLLNKQGG